MKTILKTKSAFKYLAFLFLLTTALQGFAQPQVAVTIVPPVWAPVYENINQVQYYYLPDLEVYYDVWNHEFVYLEDGNWLFSPVLPPIYGNYDLYGGHVVILDYHVHQPWMHHELYVSHYPRYYHHSVYLGSKGEYSTAYDENTNKHYYGPRENHSQPHHDEHQRPEPDTHHSNQPPQRRQAVHYHDKNVGQPVKVGKDMMRPHK